MEVRKLLSDGKCSTCHREIKRLEEKAIVHKSKKHRRSLILCAECIQQMSVELLIAELE